MPEYLSPGVYVEEIEIGAKPIEGVSTSTAGFVGMTEMGPLNKPTLVTSFAEYQRIFGWYLDEKDYGDKRYIPYSVEGFFANGGQRLFVTRVADTKTAKCSACFLPNISGPAPHLIENVKSGAVTLKLSDIGNLGKDDILLLKDGPLSEFLTFVSTAKALTLSAQLRYNHTTTDEIIKMKPTASTYKIAEDVVAGAIKIKLDNVTGLAQNDPLIINDGAGSETCIVDSVTASEKSITLKSPLLNGHAIDKIINELEPTTPAVKINPISMVKAGYTVIPINAADTKFSLNDYVMIGNEYFIITKIDADKVILIADELKYQHSNDPVNNITIELKKLVPAIEIEASNEGTWGNNVKIVVKESSLLSDAKLTKPALNQDFLELNTVTGIEKGTILKLPKSYAMVKEVIKTDDTKKVMLENPITESLADGQKISTVEFDFIISFEGPGGKFEEAFNNLSMNKNHSRYVTKIITPEASGLIKIKSVIESADPMQKILMPTQDKEPGWKLGSGADGIPQNDNDFNVICEGKDDTEPTNRTGLYVLKNIDDISIAAIPGITTQHLQNKLINHCETMKDRFAVLDSIKGADITQIQAQRNLYDSKFAALYYPWIRAFDPISKKPINVPPTGYICGIYARSDTERGVHKAPANEVVGGALDLEEISLVKGKRIITKGQQDILNPKGINCIRAFPGRGIRVWGARTISSDSLWKYINVRRLFLYVEESIYKGTQWVVFEPNNEKLWGRVKATIDEFLTRVWRDGALMGLKAEEAFFIKCDRTTMTQSDIDNGRLICVIGIAPVKPAEFVIFRIAQWAGGSAAKE